MRDPGIVEQELVAIAAMADEVTKLDAIVAWCTTHPDEVPVALHMLLSRRHRDKAPEPAGADVQA